MRLRPVLALLALLGCRKDPPPAPRPATTTAHVAPAPTTPAAPPPSTATPDPPAAASEFHDTGQYLPQGAVAEGWAQSGAVQYLNAQNLFQRIDGAADMYRAYGFRQLAVADYRKAGSDFVVTAEVYDMGSALGAFGRYSLLLSDSRDPASMQPRAVQHGGGGFLGTNELVFWKGQHLVKLILQASESEDVDEAALAAQARTALPPLAARIAAALPGETTAPAPPPALPRDGLVWSGATYIAEGALGASSVGSAWVGHYQGAGRYRVAVFSRESAREAQAVMARLRTPQATAISGVGDEAFSADGPQGELVAARKGNTVVVVANAEQANLPTLPRDAKLERLRAAISSLP